MYNQISEKEFIANINSKNIELKLQQTIFFQSRVEYFFMNQKIQQKLEIMNKSRVWIWYGTKKMF